MGFIASLLFAGFVSAHPLHVSFTNVEINEEKKLVMVSHKFYTNDFSLLFYHLFEKNIEPKTDRPFDTQETDLISKYIRHRFYLIADKDTIPMTFSGKEQDEESLWLHYSGNIDTGKLKNITIYNMLMLDLYMDQTNLVIVTLGNKEDGFSFDFENRQWVLTLRE